MNLPVLMIFALINSCIELEISAPSFVDITQQLYTTEVMVGLTITYNLVGFCIASLIYGPLSESLGRRRTMLIGNGILAISAAACVIAPSIEWLLVARFVQGIGAATSAVVVSAIIADVYSAKKAAKLYGVMNTIFTSIMALSPVLGGFINSAVGWRGNYGVVALVCIVSWVLLYFFLPETKKTFEKIKFGKIIRDYKYIVANFYFLSASSVPSLLYGCYMAFVAIAPFVYMEVFGLTLINYTLHQAVIVATFALTSFFGGSITDFFGTKKTIWTALAITIIGSSLMLLSSGPYSLSASACFFSIGSALLYPIIFAHSIDIYPELRGTASSAIMALRYLLCSAVTGLATYFYSGSSFSIAIITLSVTLFVTALTLTFAHKVQD